MVRSGTGISENEARLQRSMILRSPGGVKPCSREGSAVDRTSPVGTSSDVWPDLLIPPPRTGLQTGREKAGVPHGAVQPPVPCHRLPAARSPEGGVSPPAGPARVRSARRGSVPAGTDVEEP